MQTLMPPGARSRAAASRARASRPRDRESQRQGRGIPVDAGWRDCARRV